MTERNYEHMKFIIERFDHLIESINNKSSFYIGLNTFLLGGIAAGYFSIGDKIDHSPIFWVLLITIFLLCILSIFYTLSATSPYLKDNKNEDDIPSRIFFGGIAKLNLNTFLDKCKEDSDETILEDMYRQVHCLAHGIDSKFKRLKWVSNLLKAQFIVLVFISIYLVKNLHQ